VPQAPVAAPPRPETRPPADHDSGPQRVPAGAVRLGAVDSLRGEPILIPLEDIKIHMAFLGSTGSGKTTAALSVIEQLLERDVSVVLVDRKGDLARYADESWWADSSAAAADRERKRALRKRLDIALFTPGNSQGRPLRLPLIPTLADLKPQEREPLARYAAEGLGAMIGYGKSAAHKAKSSILQSAITLLAGERDITLDLLRDTISRPDPELLSTVEALQRYFASLSEDLQTLRIQRGSFLSGEGEPLDLAALLPAPGTGRTRLTIINTSALTEVPLLQFWISRLLVELSRLGRKRPSATLQAALFLDEADTYVPATSSPPTKDPMFDLLRRSRSTGIGVLLATQNPGDFDYKARDNINTWLLGKITQDRAVEKMRNLIANYPDVGPRLASQRTGSFFLLTGTIKRELKADRSLMETVQLPEAEVADLARQTRPASTAKDRMAPDRA
jgi:DNA helicase HerA-like ATPase